MRVNSSQLIKYCGTRTDPAGDKVNRAAGRRAGALFFARHLDYFIVTQNSQSLPGLGTVKTTYRVQTTPIHLPGPDSYREAKTRHPDPPAGGTPTQLNRRAVRLSKNLPFFVHKYGVRYSSKNYGFCTLTT